jgi:hypothetical protein
MSAAAEFSRALQLLMQPVYGSAHRLWAFKFRAVSPWSPAGSCPTLTSDAASTKDIPGTGVEESSKKNGSITDMIG